jgi:beta-phosphoglucomutase
VPDALVFDFDGVIVNSEPAHLRAFQAVLAEESVPLSAGDYYARYVGLSDRDTLEAVARASGLAWTARFVDALVARKTIEVQRALAERSPLFPAAAARIRALAAELPMAIASGALRPEIEQVLDREGLAACFVAIVAAGETRRSKPHPDPYELAVERLSRCVGRPLQPARVVGVEDTLQGLASARAAGLRTIAVTTTCPASDVTEADYVTADISGITIEVLRHVVGDAR